MTRGYILVETLTAMAILSISVLAMNGALRQATLTMAMARDFTQARFVLEQVVGSVELKQIVDPGGASGRYGGSLSHFQWSYEITTIEMPVPPVQLNPENPAHAQLLQRLMNEDGEIELPVHYIPMVRAEVTWTRGGQRFTEVVETLLDPDRLRVEDEIQ